MQSSAATGSALPWPFDPGVCVGQGMDDATADNHAAGARRWVRGIGYALRVLLAPAALGVLLAALNWRLWA